MTQITITERNHVRVTPSGVGQAGADALGDGGLDGHEGAKAGSVSWAENDTRQG